MQCQAVPRHVLENKDAPPISNNDAGQPMEGRNEGHGSRSQLVWTGEKDDDVALL